MLWYIIEHKQPRLAVWYPAYKYCNPVSSPSKLTQLQEEGYWALWSAWQDS